MKKSSAVFFVLVLSFALIAPLGAEASFPSKSIEIIAPASPGGGWDTTARAIQRVLETEGLSSEAITVANKPGAGGAIGFSYLKTKAGDGHYVSMNSNLLFFNNLLGRSDLHWSDFTVLATLATEYQSLFVHADSDIETIADLMNKLKEDPDSLAIAVSPSLGSSAHMHFVLACLKWGVDVSKVRLVVFTGGGDAMTALLGGHVDVVSEQISEAVEHREAGNVKILIVSSAERLEGEASDVPTWSEFGVDLEWAHWRGIMGPPDMSEEAIAWWDKTLSAMVKTDLWKEISANNDWEHYYRDSAATAEYFRKLEPVYREIVEQAGLAQ